MSLEDWGLAKNIALQKPTRVHQAQDRLDRAVARLETVIKDRTMSAAARDERGIKLADELRQLRVQNVSLKQFNDEVGERLDTVITNLKTALEN